MLHEGALCQQASLHERGDLAPHLRAAIHKQQWQPTRQSARKIEHGHRQYFVCIIVDLPVVWLYPTCIDKCACGGLQHINVNVDLPCVKDGRGFRHVDSRQLREQLIALPLLLLPALRLISQSNQPGGLLPFLTTETRGLAAHLPDLLEERRLGHRAAGEEARDLAADDIAALL